MDVELFDDVVMHVEVLLQDMVHVYLLSPWRGRRSKMLAVVLVHSHGEATALSQNGNTTHSNREAAALGQHGNAAASSNMQHFMRVQIK
jgi:hypothetical protein